MQTRELSNLLDTMAENARIKWQDSIRESQSEIKMAVAHDLGIDKLGAKFTALTGIEVKESGFKIGSPADIEYKRRLKDADLDKYLDRYSFAPDGWNEFIFEQKLKLATFGNAEAGTFIKEFRAGIAKLLK